jgi:predicted nuclease with RNAse H fold
MAQKIKIVGIDYGSKLAGTTAIAMLDENGNFSIIQSQKKQDADEMILNMLDTFKPELIAFDAPLSLPNGLYSGNIQDDFFYRQADKELKAMSPMFLGGLTARAMRIAAICKSKQIEIIESYPGAFVKAELLNEVYSKKDNTMISKFSKISASYFQFKMPQLNNWHAIDACICLEIGIRKANGNGRFKGNQDGYIWY